MTGLSISSITNSSSTNKEFRYMQETLDEPSIIDRYGAREKYKKHDDVIWQTLVYEQVISANMNGTNASIRTDAEFDAAYASFTNFFNIVSSEYNKDAGRYQDPADKFYLVESKIRGAGYFHYVSSLLLLDGLQYNAINCVGYSMLHIAIGQKLGWPVYPALRTEHAFICFGQPEKPETQICFEATYSLSQGMISILDEIEGHLSEEQIKSSAVSAHMIRNEELRKVDFHVFEDKNVILLTELWNYCVMVPIKNNDLKSLLALSREMYRLSPLNTKSAVMYANALASMHEYEKAKTVLISSIRKYQDSESYRMLSDIFRVNNEYENALFCIDRAIYLNPNEQKYLSRRQELMNSMGTNR